MDGEWEIVENVKCVVCPACTLTFDAGHTDWPDGGYSCPWCEARALREALTQYADHRNWSIRRDDMHRYPACVWIGPGAAETVPNAPGLARAALDGE